MDENGGLCQVGAFLGVEGFASGVERVGGHAAAIGEATRCGWGEAFDSVAG